MSEQTVLLLHPGEMGSAIGARLRDRGYGVLWAGTGRSDATRERARKAGLTDCGTIADGARRAAILISVCPPQGAIAVAEQVAGSGFTGDYIDANAISPASSAQVGQFITSAGGKFTDGGIIGPPPDGSGKARLYLSGPRADVLAPALDSGALKVRALAGADTTAASALKMCFGGWNKARTALLANLIALAESHGVAEDLMQEWQSMEPSLLGYFEERPGGTVTGNSRKAWRWNAEMREIARTCEQAGLPGGFHHAAGEVFDRLAGFKDQPTPPSLAELTTRLLDAVRTPGEET